MTTATFDDATSRYIIKRLEANYPHRPSGEAFVVSVYGEWGMGKTHTLKAIQDHYQEKLNQSIQQEQEQEQEKEKEKKKKRVYIPVFFPAWRYEKEPHLIIPLIKTIEHELHALSCDEKTEEGSLSSCLKSSANLFCKLAVSLAAGLTINVGFLKFEADKALKKAEAETDNDNEQSDSLPSYQSLYYDCNRLQHAFQTIQPENSTIHFVILIDDLDRCLPENSVNMLEAIKLFLNYGEAFSYVIGVDNDIVERGINHKYKDYRLYDKEHHQPLNGNEYLEKIVNLPIYLPRWHKEQVKAYIVKHFRDLFEQKQQITNKEDEYLERIVHTTNDRQYIQKRQDRINTQPQAINQKLLQYIIDIIPAVPRKIIRLLESLTLSHERMTNLLKKTVTEDQLCTEVSVLFLQQHFPELYRAVRIKPVLYNTLRTGTTSHFTAIARMQKAIDGDAEKSDESDYYFDLFEQSVAKAMNNRNQLNPLVAFESEDSLLRRRDLDTFANIHLYHYIPTLTANYWNDDRTAIALDQSQLIQALEQENPSRLQAFIFDNNPSEHCFDEATFEMLSTHIGQQLPPSAEHLSLLLDMLTPEQASQLYQETNLLNRIAQEQTTDG